MKARRALRRTRARAFTLLELMVVVVLIAILAAIAAPSMLRARNDQIAFNMARQTADLFHEARTRAAGTGSAHLVLFTGYVSGARGTVFVFSAKAQQPDETVASGPNPASSCRATNWTWATTFTPGTTDPTGVITFVDGLNANGTASSVQTTEDIRMTGFTLDPAGATAPSAKLALCVTPSGATYWSPDVATTALTLLTGGLQIDVTRNVSGTPVGLTRHVVVRGGGQPRIKSE